MMNRRHHINNVFKLSVIRQQKSINLLRNDREIVDRHKQFYLKKAISKKKKWN